MTEQEKFDAWFSKSCSGDASQLLKKSSSAWSAGDYENDKTHNYWLGWQAAIASREPKMRKATRDEKIVNPGVYEVPQEPPKG